MPQQQAISRGLPREKVGGGAGRESLAEKLARCIQIASGGARERPGAQADKEPTRIKRAERAALEA